MGSACDRASGFCFVFWPGGGGRVVCIWIRIVALGGAGHTFRG